MLFKILSSVTFIAFIYQRVGLVDFRLTVEYEYWYLLQRHKPG